MSNKNMFLYWGSGSAPCWKAMLVLAEYGQWDGIENKLMSFSKKEHKSEEVLKLNPRGQLPTFKDGDLVINESNAICMYLEDKYSKEDKLIPTDHNDKAAVYQRMFESANVQSMVMEPIVYYKFRTKEEDWNAEYLQEKAKAAADEMKRWDDYLDGKDFLACGKYTMADVFFFPLLAFMVRSGVEFKKSTNLKRYYDLIAQRPAVKATWPPHWSEPATQKLLGELDC